MAPASTSFTSALWQHLWLMLTCKHDGRGLPSKSSSLVYAVMVAVFVMSGVKLLTTPGTTDPGAFWVLAGVWLILAYVFVAIPSKSVEVFVGGLLLTLVQQFTYLLLLGLPDQLSQTLMLPLELWTMFCVLSLMRRHLERIRAPKNKS